MKKLILPLLLLTGVLTGCDEAGRSILAPAGQSSAASAADFGADALEAIHTLRGKVQAFHESGAIDNDGVARSLERLLSNAGDAAGRDDWAAAENMMRAFQNRVRAQRGKHIREGAADELHADAQGVIDLSTGVAPPTEADLRVTLAASPDTVTVGEELMHVVTLENPGPADAADLKVSMLVVGDVDAVSAPPECTSAAVGDGISYDCLVAALPSGASIALTIVVAPWNGGETLNTQADIVDWAGADDPDPTNNIATVATYVNSLPVAAIGLPLDGSVFVAGETITFSGSATDAEDGELSGSGLVWTSSIDGEIGTGSSFSRSDLSPGTHVFTLWGSDAFGGAASSVVTAEVVAAGLSEGRDLEWTRALGPATSPTSDLQDVWGTSGSDVWAVGAGFRNSLVHYDGSAWSEHPTGTTAGLLGVWGSSGSDVFVVGAGGTVRYFDGIGWTAHATPTTRTLRDVWGTAGDDVWAVGEYTILHFDGVSWTEQHTGARLWSVWGRSSTDVWAAGPSGIFHYDGATWQQQSTGISGMVFAVWGSGSDVFFVGSSGRIVHHDATTGTWTAQQPPVEVTNESLHGVWGTSPSDVYALGTSGTILHFDGSRWSRVLAGGPTLQAMWGDGAGSHVVVGSAATILQGDRSDWQVQSTGVTIQAIWGADAQHIFAVGGGMILRHENGGWMIQNTGLTSTTLRSAEFYGVGGRSSHDVWVVGTTGIILHYDGARWEEQRVYGSGSHLNAVWAGTSGEAFAVGATGTLLHYDGMAWNPHTSPIASHFQGVFGLAEDDVWAVGSAGGVVHYDGTTWSERSPGITPTLFGVWGAAPNRVLATGNVLSVLRHDGTGWSEHPLSGMHSGRAIWGASIDDVFVVPSGTGGYGKILHYDGTQWSVQETGLGNILFHGIWGSSATDVYAVGWGGTIIRGSR